ncbi:MAG TPA: porin [Verrucomicrobiae bacterium]|jgi:phosphate-selective porin OprO/OprP|nr:porin [Verrucomicrobiae bacterium]
MKQKQLIIAVMLAGGLVAAPHLRADETADAIDDLKKEIQALDQKVRVLERQKEIDTEAADTKAKETPRIGVGNNGLSVASADSNFVFQLHGLIQTDNRTFFNDKDNHGKSIQGNDGFLLRRARPIFSGTVYKNFDFVFMPDFGGSSVQIFDAYLNYHYAPWLQLRAGKFKVPVGLEQLQSDQYTFFNERALPTALVPNRDIGFQLWGDVAAGRLSYAVGVFNGVGDGRNSANSDFEDHREFAGRLFLQPFKGTSITPLQGLGFGVAGTWGNTLSNATGLPSGFLTDGQEQFFAYTNTSVVANGDHWRLSPQGYYYYGPFGLLGEYVISDQKVTKGATSAWLKNTAWQVAGGWVLTGEEASFTGVTPRHPFDPRANQWGALQLVARYADLDVDNKTFPVFANPATSASEAKAWAVGLNWYLNRNIRVNTSFSRTTFGGRINTAQATVARQPEEVVFTRLQLAF